MRNGLKRKVQQNNAFTLIEMLVVVAIMIILLGVSSAGYSQVASTTTMMELDSYAKTIFLEAQNQLTAKKVAGGLEAYAKDHEDFFNERSLGNLGDDYCPSDYSGDDGWKELCYLRKSETLMADLIPSTSDIVKEGSYIIEFNPKTGDVYGVFYTKSASFDYELVKSLDRTNKDARAEKELGYYGGMVGGDVLESTEAAFAQDVELINKEELYLKVSFPYSYELSQQVTAGNLNIKCVIKNGTAEKKVELGKNDIKTSISGNTIEAYVLLDSMNDNYSFKKNMTESRGLNESVSGVPVPGDDVEITVTSTLTDGDTHVLEETVKGNSLFGNGTTSDTIEVCTLRHLMNLDDSIYNNSSRKKIIVDDSIDFANTNFRWKFDGVSPTYEGTPQVCPVATFTPIRNDVLFDGATIDGKNNTIKNVNLSANADNAGLFASMVETDINNLYLEDVTIIASGYNCVGALVGYMEGGSIDNCGVHLSTYGIDTGTGNTVSHVELGDPKSGCIHTNKMEHNYDTMTIAGKEYVGGLVGYAKKSDAENVSISNSYAAIKVTASNTRAGGFIGTALDSTITGCYASGNVEAQQYAGGFIGSSASVNVSNAFAVGNVTVTGSDAGGFAGKTSNSDVYANCISYGLIAGTASGGFIGADESAKYDECKYLRQSGYNATDLETDPTGEGVKITATSYADLKANDANRFSTTNVFAYSKELTGKSFPFVKVGTNENYYGNWPAENQMETYLLYYEVYPTATPGQYDYGFYGVIGTEGSAKKWVVNTLKPDATEIVKDGYGLVSKYQLGKISLKSRNAVDGSYVVETAIDATGMNLDELTFHAYSNYDIANTSVTGESIDVMQYTSLYFYELPNEMQYSKNFATTGSFYDELVVSAELKGITGISVVKDETYYYNPYFAKLAFSEEAVVPSAVPTSIGIRSARQLYAIGKMPYVWNGVTFTQECNLNFTTYITNYCGVPWTMTNASIGSETVPFTGVYSGKNGATQYQITGYTSDAAMFGVNNGTIQNVVMDNAGASGTLAGFVGTNNGTGKLENITIQNAISTNGLIATNNGTIQTVTVQGCQITPTTDTALFVHTNNKSIDGVTVIDSSITSTSNLVSGFAHTNALDATINNVDIQVSTAATKNVEVSGTNAYGFAVTNAGTITDVSVVGTADKKVAVTGSSGGAGFVGTNTGIIGTAEVVNPDVVTIPVGETADITIENVTSNIGMITQNDATIQNVTVRSCVVTPIIDTALFVHTNNSAISDVTITDSSISNTVKTVAGFVYENTANAVITNSEVFASTKYDGMIIHGANAYGFVGTNTGNITQSFVAGKVTADTGNAAGFVGSNTDVGNIEVAYANTQLTAAGKGAGFALTVNTSKNTKDTTDYMISTCYASGTVSANRASGFVDEVKDKGCVNLCYSIVSLSTGSTNRYGFVRAVGSFDLITQTGPTVLNCVWCYDDDTTVNHNVGVTDGNNTQNALLKELEISVETAGTETHPYIAALEGKIYPYPALNLVYYGDWPVGVKEPVAPDPETPNEEDETEDALVDGVADGLAVNYPGFGDWLADGLAAFVKTLVEAFVEPDYNYTGILYYEKYKDGSVGVYAVGLNDRGYVADKTPNVIINTLKKDADIESKGYGVLLRNQIIIDTDDTREGAATHTTDGALPLNQIVSGVRTGNGTHYYKYVGEPLAKDAVLQDYVRYIFNNSGDVIKVKITPDEIATAKSNAN